MNPPTVSSAFSAEGSPDVDFWKIQGTTTVGERGQVVIPAAVRAELDISGGDRMVVFSEKQHGVVIIVKAEVVSQISQAMLTKIGLLNAETERILQGPDAGEAPAPSGIHPSEMTTASSAHPSEAPSGAHPHPNTTAE